MSIAFRLLIFNILLVFLPIASFLALGTFEDQLLASLEHALVQQARLLAAALSEGGGEGSQLRGAEALRILRNLRARHEARIRVLDRQGFLLADSSRLGLPAEPAPEREPGNAAWASSSPPARVSPPARETFLYRLASLPARLSRLMRRLLWPPEPPLESSEYYHNTERLLGSEVQAALEGRYGAQTRISYGENPSVILYSAVPVRGQNGGVTGVVLVSQSTYRILKNLYALRLEVFKVFLLSLTAALAISFLLYCSISRPLLLLRQRAREILDARGALKGQFSSTRRRDEIGELTIALQDLTRRLENRIAFTESFAADVSHELRNPLASIRSATEVAVEEKRPEVRREFLNLIQKEVARLEALIRGLREICLIDSRVPAEDRQIIELEGFLRTALERFSRGTGAAGINFEIVPAPADRPALVSLPPHRLAQIVDNLIDNAASFSPPGGTVSLVLRRRDERVLLDVIDDGPGVDPSIRQSIFARFFTFRPGAKRDQVHTGLGLAIVKAVAEGLGGSVEVATASGRGACFTVSLPAAPG